MDQVGVNAPGRPTIIALLLARRSARLILAGGKLWWSSIEGIESPTSTAIAAENTLNSMPKNRLRNIVTFIMIENRSVLFLFQFRSGSLFLLVIT